MSTTRRAGDGHRCRVLPLALVVTLLPGVGGGLADAASSSETPYAMVVERYADGDRGGACRAVVALDARQVVDGTRSLLARLPLFADERRRDVLAKAAALLHTDAAIGLRAGGNPAGVESYLGLATLYVQLSDVLPADTDLRSFARRWYLAAALDRHRYLEADGAASLLEQGLKRFPADPELRLAMGSVEEVRGTWPLRLGTSRADRRGHLEQAEKELRAALAADPALAEAHLRRGRVLLLLGRAPEAEAEIEWVLREGRDPARRYLALLFEGRLREGRGDLADAAESYRAAGATDPDGQTAHVALGHVLDRLGDVAGSRDALDRAVAKGSPLPVPLDPWWTYPYGQGDRVDTLLAELRLEARW